jgi:hypothetical protein
MKVVKLEQYRGGRDVFTQNNRFWKRETKMGVCESLKEENEYCFFSFSQSVNILLFFFKGKKINKLFKIEKKKKKS